MENFTDEYSETNDTFSSRDSVDIEYMNEMYKYETKAQKETESIDMSVEEENMIICKIKEELLNQARDGMQSELEQYQVATCRTDSTAPEYSEELDPIIRKGLYEIKRLDKILLKKMKKEKEVKKERILLQKRLSLELNEIEQRNQSLSKDIKSKVEQFLSIKPPPTHNEGMNGDTAEDEYPKLFQTEIHQESLSSSNRGSDTKSSAKSINSSNTRENKSQQSTNSKFSKTASNRLSKLDVQNKKNFVKRNIELASKAAEPVVFTDEEKDRLQYLLSDLEDETSLMKPVDEEYVKSLTSAIDENPFQVATLDQYSGNYDLDLANDGGTMSAWSADSDRTSVKHQLSIESKLKYYMGDDRYKQLSRIDDKSYFSESILYQINEPFDDDIDMNGLGEKTLKELKFTRENQERLKEIDSLLTNFNNVGDEESYHLDPDVLRDLLSSSRANMSATNFSEYSDLDSEHDNLENKEIAMGVEHLSRDLLDSLLRDARASNNKLGKKLELISEQTELSDDNQQSDSVDGLESVSRTDSVSASSERPSSRFPDIRLFKHLTSNPKYK